MKKMDSLRVAITTAMPDLKAAPKNLRMWVDRGTSQSRQTATLGFGFKYRLNVLLMDLPTTSDIATLATAIYIWARINQPDLLAVGSDGFNFEVDVLDSKTADLLLQLDLAENVSVQAKQGGGFTTTYLDEPVPMFGDDLPFGGLIPAPLLTGVAITDEGTMDRDGILFDD
jgi:hypothetical protein